MNKRIRKKQADFAIRKNMQHVFESIKAEHSFTDADLAEYAGLSEHRIRKYLKGRVSAISEQSGMDMILITRKGNISAEELLEKRK